MTIPTGRFVWFDYVAPDTKKAQAFFGELFHWKTQEIPGPYTMISAGDQTIGGYMPTPPGAPKAGHWLAYLGVADAHASAKKIESLGGKVLKAPDKMGEYGTMAVAKDPLGGVFALWQPTKPEGTGDFKGVTGTFCWNELYTSDPAKSVAFYSALGGFSEEKMPMPNGTYHVLNFDGKPRAGVTVPPAPMEQAWLPYVQVDNVDQTLERAKKLGADVKIPGTDIPNVGRFGIFVDPQGGWLGVLTPST